MIAQQWAWWVQTYGSSIDGDPTYAWCFRCGRTIDVEDADPHRMLHALEEAP